MTSHASNPREKTLRLCASLGVTAKDVRLLNGRTFVATFRTRKAAEAVALYVAEALEGVRVARGMDALKRPTASGTMTRREVPVWRVHGRLE